MNQGSSHIACILKALIALAFLTPQLHAQLASPGKLSSPHSKLEGVGKCAKCHNFGEATFRNNCLQCHKEIKVRIERSQGYHFYTRKLECSKCHKEHHGRKFKLIRWKPAAFDHKQTGFDIDGKHQPLKCDACHNPSNITHSDIKRKSKAVKNKTYLGLDPECNSCHDDEHRGQFGNECSTCHSPIDWKDNDFTHAKARFKLHGKHSSVECSKCHPAETGAKTIRGDISYIKFRGLDFKQCSSCHSDPHKSNFGEKCSSCHVPTGWKDVKFEKANFNHSKTRFALEGKHSSVACTRCHSGNKVERLKKSGLDLCAPCHSDYHKKQISKGEKAKDCSACHTEDGFSPSTFTIEEHQKVLFKLSGSHAAVPCRSCHVETEVNGAKTMKFHWDDHDCRGCHTDPHAGQFSDRSDGGECKSCHSTESWYWMEFDHTKTEYQLVGKHQNVLCAKCHIEGDVNGTKAKLFAFPDKSCTACHNDQHAGQFADTGGKVNCETCHSPYGWKPVRFDHNSQSRFALTGAHAKVTCDKCHKPDTSISDNVNKVRYKPLDTNCSACHAGADQR
jgi:hypothetical protein